MNTYTLIKFAENVGHFTLLGLLLLLAIALAV